METPATEQAGKNLFLRKVKGVEQRRVTPSFHEFIFMSKNHAEKPGGKPRYTRVAISEEALLQAQSDTPWIDLTLEAQSLPFVVDPHFFCGHFPLTIGFDSSLGEYQPQTADAEGGSHRPTDLALDVPVIGALIEAVDLFCIGRLLVALEKAVRLVLEIQPLLDQHRTPSQKNQPQRPTSGEKTLVFSGGRLTDQYPAEQDDQSSRGLSARRFPSSLHTFLDGVKSVSRLLPERLANDARKTAISLNLVK
jgi:hypothetical protein